MMFKVFVSIEFSKVKLSYSRILKTGPESYFELPGFIAT